MPAGATYEPIATTTLGADAANITFSSISSSYTDLVLVCTFTTNPSGASLTMRLNSDTASNYSVTRLNGNGTSAGSTRQSNQTRMFIAFENVGTSATLPSFARISIFSYAGSTNKTVLTEAASDLNGSGEVGRSVGLWRNTSAITSIEISGGSGVNFKTGATATLYGIKNSA